jgi:hypothetical protein
MATEAKPPQNKSVTPSLVIGFSLALVAMGLPMIGVAVNLYLGGASLLVAFILLSYGFWRWETARRWSEAARVSTLWIFWLAYFVLVGFQIFSQYKKDHIRPSIVAGPKLETNLKTPALAQQPTPAPRIAKPQSARVITPPHSSAEHATATPIPAYTSPPQQTVNAPNGIGSIGGTFINPQVNNFGYMQKTFSGIKCLCFPA